MGKWRVGTVSMGVALIALGLILLTSLLGGYDILDKLVTWWPLILIMLGAEILIYIFRSREEQVKINYDVFSIFMLLVIFVSSGILYGITSTGVVGYLATAVNSRDYSVMIPQEEIAVKKNINKIVINASQGSNIEVHRTEGDNIIYSGNGDVFTNSLELAEEMMNKVKIHLNEMENTLYLQFSSIERKQDIKPGVTTINYSMYIPEGVDVEINGKRDYHSKITINGEAISGNWLVNEINNVQVRGNGKSDFRIEAITEYGPSLRGNIEWDLTSQENGYTVGRVSFGNGKYKLNILRGNIEVLELP